MEIIDLEMIPGGPKKTCHASQFDNGRVIRFNLKENGQPFALSGTETVQAIIRKPDGSETTLDIANTSSTYVDLITEADTCDIAGVNHCEMKVTEDGEDLGSGNFDMKVEEDAYGGGDVSVGSASGAIASFDTDIKDNLVECVCEINPVQDLHGYDHPWPAGGGKNKINPDTVELSALTVSDGIYSATDGDNRDTLFFKLQGFLGNTYAGYQVTTPPIVQTGKISLKITIPNNIDKLRFANAGQSNEFTFRFPCPFPEGTVATFSCYILDITMGAVKFKEPQLEIGSTATDYEPYENVCPIEGHTEMDIIRSGVNIWDGNKQDNVGVNATTGNLYASTGTFTTDYILIKPNAIFYANPTNWKTWACFYDSNKNYLSYTSIVNGILTTPANAYYMRVSGDMTALDTACINYPSTDTAYHPAAIIEKTIQLGQTVYRARINTTTGQGIIDQAGIDLGSLTWEKKPTVSGKWRFVADITNAKRTENVRAIPDAICTKYVPVSPLDTWNGINGFTIDWESDRSFICDLNIEDATAFNNAMNGILMVYELKNPVSIQLTPEQIETLLGQNNVYHNANGDTAVKFYTRA